MATSDLRSKALALRGKKSMGLIAKELGITRNQVAGIFFRHAHPGQRFTGAGRGGGKNQKAAKQVIRQGGKPGRTCRWHVRKALGRIVELINAAPKIGADLRVELLQIGEAAIQYADNYRDIARKRARATFDAKLLPKRKRRNASEPVPFDRQKIAREHMRERMDAKQLNASHRPAAPEPAAQQEK